MDYGLEGSILATLNTDEGLLNVLEGELEDLVRIAPNEPPATNWAKFRELFLLDAEQELKMQDPEEEFQIPFTKLCLRSYQVWDAFYVVTTRKRHLHGGILAYLHPSDSTTYKQVCSAACFIRALLTSSKADYAREWMICELEQDHQRRHLPRGASSSQRCRSGDPLGIKCYCSGGVTQEVADSFSRGKEIIFVRKESVDEWVKLIEKCSPDKRYYEPLLIHHFYRENLRPQPEFKGKMEITPSFRRTTSRGEQSVFDADWHVQPPSSHNPERQPERHIVLVGQEAEYLKRYRTSMSNRLDDFGFDYKKLRLVGQTLIDPSKPHQYPYSYGAYVGLHLIDQFEKVPHDSPIFRLIKENTHIVGKAIETWTITAKPKSKGFAGLRSFLKCIERRKWVDPGHDMHYKHHSTLEESEMIFQRAVDPKMAASSDYLTLAKEHFRDDVFRTFASRRTLNSTWFGLSISKYVQPTVISFNTPRKGTLMLNVQGVLDKARADIRTAAGGLFNVNQVVRSRWAYDILDDKVDVSPQGMEAQLAKQSNRRCSMEYFPMPQEQFDELTAISPKLTTILQAIETMLGMVGESQKMMITCLHLFEATLVMAGIRNYFGTSRYKTLYLSSRPTADEKRIFSQYWSTEDRNATRNAVVLADFDEHDLGLDRANWQILTGPARTEEDEAKIFSLTNTRRQQRRLHHFLLCAEDNVADRLILSRQAALTITSDPFDMNNSLRFKS